MEGSRQGIGAHRLPYRCIVHILAGVFGIKDWLAIGDKRRKQVALIVLVTLLVDAEVKVVHETGYLIEIILETHRQTPIMRSVGDVRVKI